VSGGRTGTASASLPLCAVTPMTEGIDIASAGDAAS
jgi:hypothetical protein